MLTMALKNRFSRNSIILLSYFSKREQLVIRIMFSLFFLEAVASLYFINIWFFSDNSQYALAATALADTTYKNNIKPGLATGEFINELQEAGLNPIVNQKIGKRLPFSVEGVLVSLDTDNIQIFEYPDHKTARKEGLLFAEKYMGESVKNRWKGMMYVYIRDKIVIFYMGKEENILTALSKGMNPLSTLAQ